MHCVGGVVSTLKTKVLPLSLEDHLATLPPNRGQEAKLLDKIFREASGYGPEIWTGGIVGYGRYSYTYASGHSGEWMATGFAARKAKLSIYVMPGYADFGLILDRLGPHKTGKSCLYITRLSRVDPDVLAELIRAGLADLSSRWPIRAT